MEVSFELNVTVVLRVVPEEVCTAAVKVRIPPRASEEFVAGERTILLG